MSDPTETRRREMIANDEPRTDLIQTEAAAEPTWDTQQMQAEFEVLGFAAPFVVVRKRDTGERGTLEFTHQPRVYFGWQAD